MRIKLAVYLLIKAHCVFALVTTHAMEPSSVSALGITDIQSQGHDTSNFYSQSDSILQVSFAVGQLPTCSWCTCVLATYMYMCICNTD